MICFGILPDYALFGFLPTDMHIHDWILRLDVNQQEDMPDTVLYFLVLYIGGCS